MIRPRAVPAPTPSSSAHTSARASSKTAPTRPAPLDAQLRAAKILGRIIDFFDTVDAASTEVLERTRGLLVDELAGGRADWSRTPHDSRRRNAVFTAALACVQAASAKRVPGAEAGETGVTAGNLLLHVHDVLDGVRTLKDPYPPTGGPRGVDVLAHMLQGAEPRTWSRDQQDFARCALKWMQARVDDDATEDGSEGRVRWSAIARRNRGSRWGPTGEALSA